jgi:hypothetical protein
MKTLLRYFLCVVLALALFTTSCGSIKTLHVWKDDTYQQRLQKVLVIAVAEQDFMQKHFENVLSESLASRGIEATPGNKVFPQTKGKLDREAILAKVKELGFSSVLVARSVNKKEVSELAHGQIYFVPTSFQQDWYGFYADSLDVVAISGRQYDAEYFTLVTNVYDVTSEKLIWSYLSEVKVENSREGALNPFIDRLIKQLEDSKLL